MKTQVGPGKLFENLGICLPNFPDHKIIFIEIDVVELLPPSPSFQQDWKGRIKKRHIFCVVIHLTTMENIFFEIGSSYYSFNRQILIWKLKKKIN